jgi:hypothetical protein
MSWGVERQLRWRLMQKLQELEPAGDPWPVYWALSTRRARRRATLDLVTWMLMPSLVAVLFIGTAQASEASSVSTARAEGAHAPAVELQPNHLVEPRTAAQGSFPDRAEWIEKLFALWPRELLVPEPDALQPHLPPRVLFAGDVGARRLAIFSVGGRTVWFDGPRQARPERMFLLPGYADAGWEPPARIVRGLRSVDGSPTQVLFVLASAGSTVRLYPGDLGPRGKAPRPHLSVTVEPKGYLVADLSAQVRPTLVLYVDPPGNVGPTKDPIVLFAAR